MKMKQVLERERVREKRSTLRQLVAVYPFRNLFHGPNSANQRNCCVKKTKELRTNCFAALHVFWGRCVTLVEVDKDR